MSWRGSTGHIDANVPDYQKMLQSNYPSSGWSSTQSSYPSYSGRFPGATSHGGGSNYTAQQGSGPFNRSGQSSYTGAYQPSKYGVVSDTSYASKSDSHHGSHGNLLHKENTPRRQDINYDNLTYGYVAREFDFGPYRSAKHRDTDYSSDSGRGRVTSHMTDYSSDSGMNLRRHRRKSTEFELETPSPETSRQRSHTSRTDEPMLTSVKSKVPFSYSFQSKNSEDMLSHNDSHDTLPPYQHNYHSHLHDQDEHQGKNSTQNNRLHTSDNHSHGYDDAISHFNHNNHNDSSPRNGDISGPGNDTNLTEGPVNDDIDFVHREHGSPHEPQHKKPEEEEEEFHSNFHSPPLYKGDLSRMSVLNHSGKPPRGPSGDLTRWQQSQRGDSKFDHITAQRHRQPRDSYKSATHDSYHPNDPDFTHHHDNHDPPSPRQHATDQMNNLRSAADAIIRDKDAIIDELRSQVLSLQEATKEYENKLRRSAMTRGSNSEEPVSFSKMQDLEYRNAELRTELAKLRLTKDTEVEDLEIKLGGVEHEVVQLKAALRKAQPNTAEMKEKLQQKDEEVEQWKQKHGQLKNRYQGLHEKLEGMERYLADLPTQEEFNKQSQQLIELRDDDDLKTAQVADLEERLTETTQLLSEKETTIQELEGKQQQLAAKMRELTTEMKRIKSEGEGKALRETQDELSETQEVKERLSLDLEKAKKLLEMNHRRLRQLEVKHQAEIRQVRERLTQEEESVVALREEARLHEQQIAKLKKSLKEFASKNQDLMDEGLVLKEQIKQLENMSADENQKLQRRFVKEMGVCFTELQTLVQICMQRAEGKEPDISLLLGMKGSAPEDDEGAVGGSKKEEQTLKHWFTKLKELRAELEKVRKMICNKYAEEMGDNLNCATQ